MILRCPGWEPARSIYLQRNTERIPGSQSAGLAVWTFAPPTGNVGRTFTVQNAVKNYGTATAGPFYAGFYLSTDTTITTGDTLIGYRYYSSGLGANTAGANEYTSVTIPSSVPAGAYYLGMISDYTNAVSEGE